MDNPVIQKTDISEPVCLPGSKKTGEKNRIHQLDFLRGIAIILVLFNHHAFIPWIQKRGASGVDLFFVLSGYLVSGLLFSEYKRFGNIRPFLFLARRALKIYPGFYVLIFVTLLISFGKTLFSGDWPYSIGSILSELTFTQNYFGGMYVHTWSLAVEAHFYFLIVLIITTLLKMNTKKISAILPVLLIAVVVFCPVLRVFTFNIKPYDFWTHFTPTHLRLDALATGVFISYMVHFSPKFVNYTGRKSIQLLICGIVLSLLGSGSDSTSAAAYAMCHTCKALGFGAIVLSFLVNQPLADMVKRFTGKFCYGWICRIGFYSYSIYLWHMFIIKYVLGFLHHGEYLGSVDNRLQFLIYFLVSVLWGIGAAKLIEIPFLSLRDRVFKRRAVTLPAFSIRQTE